MTNAIKFTARGGKVEVAVERVSAELHGGSVRAESAGEGLGATFVVHLPLAAVHRDAPSASRLHPGTSAASDFAYADLSRLKVLVVDDEFDARELIRRVLTDCGAQLLTANSAAEALPLIEKERPDVLVSDIGMPEVDGYELLRRVRALGAARGGKVPAGSAYCVRAKRRSHARASRRVLGARGEAGRSFGACRHRRRAGGSRRRPMSEASASLLPPAAST